ncbi:MAG: hypothetical protein HY774_18265 [Acidobacteria bacterium]|nr:hypothetical protein [Acidobacteriota bacterium]
MSVQRSPQVSLYYEDLTIGEMLRMMIDQHPLPVFGMVLVLLVLAGGLGFEVGRNLVNNQGGKTSGTQSGGSNEVGQLRQELTQCQTEFSNLKASSAAQINVLQRRVETEAKTMQMRYEYDLDFLNRRVDEYREIVGRTPEARKREAFLNLLISYQTANDFARRQESPQTVQNRERTIEELQKFVLTNLKLTPTERTLFDFSLIVEPNGASYRVTAQAGNSRRLIPAQVIDPIAAQIRANLPKK